MKSVTYPEVLELKKAVREAFGVNVHFHDMCSYSSFSLDEPNEAVSSFIERYFSERGARAAFNDGRTAFTLE